MAGATAGGLGARLGDRLPLSGADWRLMGRTARLVLSVPAYAVLAVVVALLALSGFVLSQNLTLLTNFVLDGRFPLADRLYVLLEMYPLFGTYFDLAQSVLLYVVAALTGVDVAMATYHFREHGLDLQTGGTGALGVALGALGAGCAACGSAVVLGLFSLLGVQVSLLFLPLEGLEFALGATVVLLLSVYWLADGMRGGRINGCPVDL